jgi:hypothetical protein
VTLRLVFDWFFERQSVMSSTTRNSPLRSWRVGWPEGIPEAVVYRTAASLTDVAAVKRVLIGKLFRSPRNSWEPHLLRCSWR